MTAARAAPPLQQLLQPLSARMNSDGAPKYLEWIQATVAQAIQTIPVEEVLFFVSDEKYMGADSPGQSLDPQADQGTGRRCRPKPCWMAHQPAA